MKKIIYYFSMAGLLAAASCTFKDDINVDPNNPLVVKSPATLVTTAQVGFAYTYGGDFSRFACMFANQLSGAANQLQSIDNFNFLTSDTDDAWDNSYKALKTLEDAIQKSKGSPHYSGICKIMKALVLGTVADHFGPSPYKTAIQGKEDGSGLQPTYDSGPENYADIQALLDQGIAEVDSASSILEPGPNDNIFGGDMAQWKQFAYALKARYYLHTAKRNSEDYDKALAAAQAAQGVTAKLVFAGASVGSQNPLYQFQTQRGDINTGLLFTNLLRQYKDPRGIIYVTDTGGQGSTPGTADGSNTAGDDYVYPNANPNDPIYFVNVSEPYFIAAEVLFRKGSLDEAATAHNQGVIGSLQERGAENTQAFIDSNAKETAATISLEKIMTQKYMALYLNPEAFADVRRTGIPQIITPPNSVTGGVPIRKFPYPQKEQTLNASHVPTEPNPPGIGRVWWDVP